MALDPNIPLQVQNQLIPEPQDFLTKLNQLQKIHNENQLFKLDKESLLRAGQKYQQFLGPEGMLDEPGLARALAADPLTAWRMPEYQAQMQARIKERQAIEAAEIANVRTRMTLIGDALGGLSALDNPTQADVFRAVSRMFVALPNDSKFRRDVLKQLQDMPKDGTGLKKWIEQMQLQTMEASKRFELTNPTPVPVQAGGTTAMIMTPRVGNTSSRVVGRVEHTPTTEEMNAPVEVKNAAGDTLYMLPRADVQPMFGGSGKLFTAPRSDGLPQQGMIAPGPATVAEEQTFRTNLAKYVSEELPAKISAAEQLAIVQQSMLELMQTARTGGGGERRTALARIGQALGMNPADVDAVQGGDLAAAQAFQKKALDLAWQRVKALAPSGTQLTGQEVIASSLSSPNLDMDPKAVELIFNLNNKIARYYQEEQKFLSNIQGMTVDGKPVTARNARGLWNQIAQREGLLSFAERNPNAPAPGLTKGKVPEGLNPADWQEGQTHAIVDGKGGRMYIRKRNGTLEVVTPGGR